MAKARDSFAIALSDLRVQLRDGRFTPGSLLNVSALAETLAISITPIREALAHLAGERLIEERRGLGYFAPRVEAGELAGLYRLHGIYVTAALRDPIGASGRVPWRPLHPALELAAGSDPRQQRADTEWLFEEIVRSQENRPLSDAHRQIADRLAPARLHEGQVLGNLAEEILVVVDALKGQDGRAMLRLIGRYHARRAAAAIRIAACLADSTHYNSDII